MQALFSLKRTVLKASISSIICLGSVAINHPASAITINFDDWSTFGDVQTSNNGAVAASNNALFDDDFGMGLDEDFNFSGDAAIDSILLESDLDINPLDPDPDNFVFAFEGSGLTEQLTLTMPSVFSFDWTFLTNDETLNDGGINIDDYAFIAINGVVETLASTQDILNPSNSNYLRQSSGRFSRTLAAGMYNIALGVVDVDEGTLSSALQVNNAKIEAVPEPFTILGSLAAIGVGTVMKRRFSSSQND